MYIALDLTGSGKAYATNRPLVVEEADREEKEEKPGEVEPGRAKPRSAARQ
ncbi:MAG: hypothetical protein IJR89_04970 [Clostridia bacterium]|nr:hypothetical protein [Clostridia bacterium]